MKNLKYIKNKFSLNDGRKNLIKKLKNLNKEKKMKSLMFFVVLLFTLFTFSGCQDMNQGITSSDLDGNKITSFTGSADGITLEVSAAARHFEGTGTSSLNNGECTVVMDYFMTSYNPGTGNGTSGLGRAKIIAQNGNELHLINVGGTFNITAGICTFTATADIAGGTGEYINALGTATVTGTINVVTRVTHAEWTGSLYKAKPFSGNFNALNMTVTEPPCITGYVRRHAEGDGNVLHFGNCQALLDHCFSYTTGMVIDGNGKITAANGDYMSCIYNGFVVPISGTTQANVTLLCKISGGTGKFDGSAGAFIANAVQDMITGEATGTILGAIDY